MLGALAGLPSYLESGFSIEKCHCFCFLQDTPGAQRQILREMEVLGVVRHLQLSHIVDVAEIRVEPVPMILMRKEPSTFSCMLKGASNSDPREVTK